MRGLCHKCFTSNVELFVSVDQNPICKVCKGLKPDKIFEPCRRCKTELCYNTKECLLQVMKVDKK